MSVSISVSKENVFSLKIFTIIALVYFIHKCIHAAIVTDAQYGVLSSNKSLVLSVIITKMCRNLTL